MALPALIRCCDFASARVHLLPWVGIKGPNELVRVGIWISLPNSNENEASVVNSPSSVRVSFKLKMCLPQTGLYVDLDR